MKQRYLPWVVVFSAATFFFYEFIQMNMFSSLDPHLMKAFHIDATQLGRLAATYFYSTILFLLPAGLILDRVSTRKVIISALSICVIGTLLFATAKSYWFAEVCRFFTGIGSAFCFLSSMRLASRWFPPKRMALVAGLIVAMAMSGGAVAQTPLTLLVNSLTWRGALMVDGLIGMLFLALIVIVVRDYPVSDKAAHEAEQQRLEALGYWKSMGSSYLRLRNWLCGIFTCALNLPIFLLGGLFGSLYLEQVKHLSSLQSSYPAMAIFIGTVIGSPIAGWVSDKMRLRRLPMRIGALLSLAAIFTIIYVPMSLHGYVIFFFLLGLVSSVQIISYPTVTESNPRILTTTSVSVVSFTTLSGGAIFQPLFGYIMDKSGDSHVVKGVHVYSAVAYDHAMLIMPIAFAVGLIATLFIRETHCQPTLE